MNFLKNIGKKAKPIAKSLLCKKVLMLAIVAACAISQALAADGIAGKLTEIGANFKGYVEPVRNIVYALAAICAVIGAFTIYFKMTNGEQDVKNILVLQNWLERRRKEVINKILSINRISEFLNFPILAQPTLKKI